VSRPRYGWSDRNRDRKHKLPRGRAYSVSDNDVTIGDGTVLKVAHYAPVGVPRGTLVAMTPYGRMGTMVRGTYGLYAAQGFNVVIASLRGTFGSGGRFDPMFRDAEDYRDVIAWMRAQSWYTGSFATFGASYLGWVQWALLTQPQPDHKAAIIVVGPHDFKGFHWGTGTFTSSLPMWAAILDAQEKSVMRVIGYALRKGEPIYRLLRKAPVAEAIYSALSDQKGWLEDRITHEVDDPYWAPLDLSTVLDRVTIPVLISSGWQDIFLDQSVEQYARLRGRGVDAALTVGPWEHTKASGGPMLVKEAFEWIGSHLTGDSNPRRERVHLHVTGADEWRNLDAWPPAVHSRRLHLTRDGLADSVSEGDVSFPFDPENPPTFPGGPLLIGGGYADDTVVGDRQDVFAVSTPALDRDLEIHGKVAVVLDHSAEHPDSNIFVRLSEIDERGRSRNVAQGVRRVYADGVVQIELTPIAHRFTAGHRIRIAVAGGAYPHFPSSPGTGENPALAAGRVANRHTIRLSGSYVSLPVSEP